MDYDSMRSFVCKHTFGTWRKQKSLAVSFVCEKANGSTFYDEKDNPYIDFSSQLMCSNLGHNNKHIIDAIKNRLTSLHTLHPLI